MTVTLRDIADGSGVSVQTASQILSEKGGPFRAETRERVLQVAERLGYRANAAARATRSGRTGSIALLLSSETNNSLLPRELLEGIQDGLTERRLNLIVARIPDETLQDEARVPRIVQEWAVDGLLINYNSNVPESLSRIMARHHIPAVWINAQREADCVFPDDERGGREATEYLLSLGHRRIAFVDFVLSTHYSAAARQKGYETAMNAAGLPPQIVREHPRLHNFIDGEAEFLLGPDAPTAVLAYNTNTLRTLFFLAAAHRIAIPQRLSVIGFALNTNEVHPLPTDILRLPERDMGRSAVEMLQQKIARPDVLLGPRAVPAELQRSGTTAPPARA